MKSTPILIITLLITVILLTAACSSPTVPSSSTQPSILPTTNSNPSPATGNNCNQANPITQNTSSQSCALPTPIKDNIDQNSTPASTENTTEPEFGQLQTDYTILEIENSINEIFGESFAYHQNDEFPSLIFGNARKSVIIAQVKENIGDEQEFLAYATASNYDLASAYQNNSLIATLHVPLTSADTKYFKEYQNSKDIVLKIEKEQSIDLNNGRVLEYQLQYLKTDEFNNYKGRYAPSIVVYKVYCGPHAILFLKPDWIETERSSGGTIQDEQNNFMDEISHMRKDMLSKSDKLLKKCPVTYSFFEEMQDINTEKTTKLAYDRRIYWERMANVNLAATINIKNTEYRNISLVKQIEFSMTNNDAYSIRDELYLDIIAQADSGAEKMIISNKLLKSNGISSQESLERSYVPEFDTQYQDTLKLKILVHRTKNIENIKPIIFTYNRDGKIIDQQQVEY